MRKQKQLAEALVGVGEEKAAWTKGKEEGWTATLSARWDRIVPWDRAERLPHDAMRSMHEENAYARSSPRLSSSRAAQSMSLHPAVATVASFKSRSGTQHNAVSGLSERHRRRAV